MSSVQYRVKKAIGVPYASIPSTLNSNITHSKFITPFHQCLDFTIIGDSYVCAFVITLLFGSRPAAIFGAVVAVHIYAVDGMFDGRTATHIGQEVFKRIKPTVAHLDATTSVVLIIFVIRVQASCNDSCPCSVF